MTSIRSIFLYIALTLIAFTALFLVYTQSNNGLRAEARTLAVASMCVEPGEHLNQGEERETFYIGCAAYLE